jgi:hypothetical protein
MYDLIIDLRNIVIFNLSISKYRGQYYTLFPSGFFTSEIPVNAEWLRVEI